MKSRVWKICEPPFKNLIASNPMEPEMAPPKREWTKKDTKWEIISWVAMGTFAVWLAWSCYGIYTFFKMVAGG
jgi:hypothetical protein